MWPASGRKKGHARAYAISELPENVNIMYTLVSG